MSTEDATVIAAGIAAVASVTTLFLNTKLSESREKRRLLWERELERFFELEEAAGRLVQDLLAFRFNDADAREVAEEKREFLHAAGGRFRRYPDVAGALGELHHCSGWYITQGLECKTREEFEEARTDLDRAYRELLFASDAVLSRHPWWRKFFTRSFSRRGKPRG